jgi:hypothetical protein
MKFKKGDVIRQITNANDISIGYIHRDVEVDDTLYSDTTVVHPENKTQIWAEWVYPKYFNGDILFTRLKKNTILINEMINPLD